MRRLGGLFGLALPLVLAGASGCNTYKYFDINVSFDQGTLDDSQIRSIARCRMLITGADTANFILMNCPNRALPDPHTVGVFEYSSFSDSGTMNFELQAFAGNVDKPECLVAKGDVAVPITATTTLVSALTAAKNPGYSASCLSVTPPTDGGL